MLAKRSRRRRLTTTLALASCLLGCGSAVPEGEPMQLLTGVEGCYAGGEQGKESQLVADPDYGARFDGKPVMWPVGFTGVRLVGGEVAVLDVGGRVVATTGRKYFISYGAVFSHEHRSLMDKTGAFPAAANCPYPWDFHEVH